MGAKGYYVQTAFFVMLDSTKFLDYAVKMIRIVIPSRI